MPFRDSDVTGGRVRVKVSHTAGETIGGSGLVPGELALNTTDGRLFHRNGSFPSGDGITKIVTLTQSAYDAITATASVTTLYVVTPDPE
jgi:hypothetical protein